MPIFEGNGVLRSGNVFLSNDNESLINESIFCSASDRCDDVLSNQQHFSFQKCAIKNRSNFASEGLRTLAAEPPAVGMTTLVTMSHPCAVVPNQGADVYDAQYHKLQVIRGRRKSLPPRLRSSTFHLKPKNAFCDWSFGRKIDHKLNPARWQSIVLP